MPTKRSENIFIAMEPIHRVLISFFLSLISFLFIRKANFNWMMIGMVLWDVFALSYIITSWIVFFTSSITHITKRARQDDGSRFFVFLIVVFSSFACMVTVLLLIISKDAAHISKAIYLPVIVSGMLLSWTIVHTTFGFHYAHLYYDNDEGTEKKAAGLNFPEEKNPDYLDFAYFSFVIGMTFQVSDVEISSRTIRRQALVHGLLSFLLNTFVVALTINLIAGLKS
jgi:uncharacterized membrane protein